MFENGELDEKWVGVIFQSDVRPMACITFGSRGKSIKAEIADMISSAPQKDLAHAALDEMSLLAVLSETNITDQGKGVSVVTLRDGNRQLDGGWLWTTVSATNRVGSHIICRARLWSDNLAVTGAANSIFPASTIIGAYARKASTTQRVEGTALDSFYPEPASSIVPMPIVYYLPGFGWQFATVSITINRVTNTTVGPGVPRDGMTCTWDTTSFFNPQGYDMDMDRDGTSLAALTQATSGLGTYMTTVPDATKKYEVSTEATIWYTIIMIYSETPLHTRSALRQ